MEENEKTIIENKKSRKEKVIIILCIIMIALSLFMLFVRFVWVDRQTVEGVSMYPTIEDGEKIWVNKLKKPDRFDVVVIENTEAYMKKAKVIFKEIEPSNNPILKRIVGIAGDTLWVSLDGWLCIQDAKGNIEILVNENYTKDEAKALSPLGFWLDYEKNFSAKITIEEGYVFVLGDCRATYVGTDGKSKISVDSRAFGVVDVKDVVSVVI